MLPPPNKNWSCKATLSKSLLLFKPWGHGHDACAMNPFPRDDACDRRLRPNQRNHVALPAPALRVVQHCPPHLLWPVACEALNVFKLDAHGPITGSFQNSGSCLAQRDWPANKHVLRPVFLATCVRPKWGCAPAVRSFRYFDANRPPRSRLQKPGAVMICVFLKGDVLLSQADRHT